MPSSKTGSTCAARKPTTSTARLSHYRSPAAQLEIQYRLDSSAQAENQADLTDQEGSQLRGAIAGMNWAARQARPDLSAAASVIASSFPTPKVSDAKSDNKAIKSAKERKFDMVLWSFREGELRRICVEDSAFDLLGREVATRLPDLPYHTETGPRRNRASIHRQLEI